MRLMTAAGVMAMGLGLVATTGCSRESNQQQPVKTQSDAGASTAPASAQAANERGQALVRVVNAVPDQPALAVTADQDMAFKNVDYKAVTPYKEIPASADDFALKPATDTESAPIAENSEAIMSGRHYTLIAFAEPGEGKKATLDVIADDLVAPPEGKARIRVINAAAGTDDVAVYLRGQDSALFTDMDFKESADYKEVDPVRTSMELRVGESTLDAVNPKTGERPRDTDPAAGLADRAPRKDGERADVDRKAESPDDRQAESALKPGEVLATHALNLEAGRSYTIVLTGRAAEGNGRPQLDTLVVEDMVPAQAASAPTE